MPAVLETRLVVSGEFEDVFRSADTGRDNFLARLFGIFSEDVVRYWCRNPGAKYQNLGRPTVFTPEGRWHTLDFTLRHRETKKTYASEMKCELAFEGYRYLRLVDCDQLTHHAGAAFARFLELARPGHNLTVKTRGQVMHIDGAVLVWGALTREGADAVSEATGIADVLSVEEMLSDLHRWQDQAWTERVRVLGGWSHELFDYLAGKNLA